MIPISVTILTRNSQKYLVEVLTALSDFDEVLLYDVDSTDNTVEMAAQFPNVTLIKGHFTGFGSTHNRASSLAKHDWILSIDSDEVVTEAMKKEIAALSLNRHCVYSFPRNNYYNEKWIKWCGWYPDRQIRLYNRKETAFSHAQVHEAIIVKDKRVELTSPMIHYSYASLSDFLIKMETYSNLFALQNKGKRHSSPLKALGHGWFTFFRSYVLKRGFLGGYEGFVISAYNGHTAFYKYLKLYEANIQG